MRKSDELTLSAMTCRSDFFSVADVELERVPASGHSTRAINASRLDIGNAAEPSMR